jgi:hypothetical protein
MNVKIMGADQSATNVSGNNWVDVKQVTAYAAQLHKLTISPLAGMAADVYVWIFDLAAGAASSAAPIIVRYVPAGLADSWDFGQSGAIFRNGIYLALSTVAPTDATTTATASGNNKVILKADFRLL